MLRTRRPLTTLALLTGISAAAALACSSDLVPQEQIGTVEQALTVALKPASDVVKTNVNNQSGSTSSLYLSVDDGTAFTSADGDTTYVKTTSSSGTHRVGYSGGSAG